MTTVSNVAKRSLCMSMQERARFGKRAQAAPTGQGVAGKAMSHACRFCGKQRVISLSNSVVVARLWDIVAKHVK